MSDATRTLYRPVGLAELELIAETDYSAFPPRLPQQPIFYPVLNETYAAQIARDWNTKDPNSGYIGAVTRFTLPSDYLDQFEEHVVGASVHRELWVPADELATFNAKIIGVIAVVSAFYGEKFSGDKIWG